MFNYVTKLIEMKSLKRVNTQMLLKASVSESGDTETENHSVLIRKIGSQFHAIS